MMGGRLLVLATQNPHKLEEMRAVLADFDVELRGCADYPGCPEVVEDGETLEANANKKAREICAFTGAWSLADDTGLEVEALDGAPGVYSARYAGPGCTYDDNNAKLLRELAGVPRERRGARFRSVIALATPASPTARLFEGRIDGRILEERRGTHGFGYDPLFYLPSEGCTLAELPAERKNAVSHRARALQAFREAMVVEWSRST